MQIVGGKFRGRLLHSPNNRSIRPTNSRTKKAIFDILIHVYPEILNDGRVLDMFAGTGSIGFEALSRGCRHVLFIDNNIDSIRLIRRNAELLGVESNCDIFCINILNLGKIGNIKPFRFLYLDPPYGKGLAQKALNIVYNGGWLEYNALVIVEDYIGSNISFRDDFKLLQNRRYGDSQVYFFCYNPT
ncbi:16S rRNA (guanine(966)-N(2))-methyltransferase RsmD [Candidatus Liberibacter americanus]|uniref:N6-adenine-specific methylase n=1 Tax=Candidatus Liberibacter americanus str. Sao Paulo TaxID=1261131 RepID=U6B7C8_9HYPH|nr:16S rRNA (guanine(966)-N(2))-methyltransferase RsmD [Candidatus Liberibacter americanus]AHA27662.1 N6-adenine-specific methylase [Candidatus Liberibacter americanus str. Sao Paulo]EMS36371.1 hypothetical protein G653_01808 [Candidatus Liberibacter americanus PW_SP]